MKDFETLSQAMNALREEGYVDDLTSGSDHLLFKPKDLKLHPEDFQVDQYFRFEGMSNPSDSSILYAISSKKHKLKGQLVNAYGIYSEEITDEMLRKMTVEY